MSQQFHYRLNLVQVNVMTAPATEAVTGKSSSAEIAVRNGRQCIGGVTIRYRNIDLCIVDKQTYLAGTGRWTRQCNGARGNNTRA